MALAHNIASRYVLPLREGGSLPAIVDTESGGQFVIKFRGAGQGPKALVAEAIAAGLAQVLGLPVPEPSIIEMADGFGMSEPDPEVQDLLRASVGANFGLRYLPGALGFDVVADRKRIDPALAAGIVWFDALIANVDRTARNPNLLIWQGGLWLIDHGASFYFHHSPGWQARSHEPFPLIKQHILLGMAGDLEAADARLRPLLTPDAIAEVAYALPDEWLGENPEAEKQAYVVYLVDRLNGGRPWLQEAKNARGRS